MWAKFEGVARSREETLARINVLRWSDWKPQGITLHNTAAPTLKQWAESGAAHDARIRNLQSYYEGMGWHSGPHFFVSRNWINWFSNPLLPGVHSRCWNSTHFGIEMVGDYGSEPFESGDGALVRDNAVFLLAALNIKFAFKAEDLTFHKECKLDDHDCPGRLVIKSDVIARVNAKMAELRGQAPAAQAPSPAPVMPGVIERQGVVNADDGLELRRGAGTGFESRGRIPKGTALQVFGEKLSGQTNWLSVRTPEGYEGWVAAHFVDLT